MDFLGLGGLMHITADPLTPTERYPSALVHSAAYRLLGMKSHQRLEINMLVYQIKPVIICYIGDYLHHLHHGKLISNAHPGTGTKWHITKRCDRLFLVRIKP